MRVARSAWLTSRLLGFESLTGILAARQHSSLDGKFVYQPFVCGPTDSVAILSKFTLNGMSMIVQI